MKISATRREKTQPLPGDEYITDSKGSVTYAITIHAAPEEIFPWIKQMGCRRGGWYSYDAIDNGGRPSAQEIITEFQKIKIGDFLPASPKDPPGVGFEVADVKENVYLVLTTFSRFPSLKPIKPNEEFMSFWKTTWMFYLNSVTPKETRLMVRNTIGYNRWWTGIFAHMIAKPFHFLMQKKQLNTIKTRVEE